MIVLKRMDYGYACFAITELSFSALHCYEQSRVDSWNVVVRNSYFRSSFLSGYFLAYFAFLFRKVNNLRLLSINKSTVYYLFFFKINIFKKLNYSDSLSTSILLS